MARAGFGGQDAGQESGPDPEAPATGALSQAGAILDALPDLLFVADLEGRIFDFRAPDASKLYVTPERFLGLRFRDVLPPAVSTAIEAALQDALDHGIHRGTTYSLDLPDGPRWFDLSVARAQENAVDGVRFVALARDVTERKQAEALRATLEAELRQAQKLESLGVLAGGIAHDFNNLLTVIRGNSDLALLDLPPDSPVRPLMTEIDEVSQRAADLCQQMLAYAGKGRFVVRPVDLSAEIRSLEEVLRVAARAPAELRLELGRDLPPVEADPTQLQQIVMNLLVNASEALGEAGGTIRMSTASQSLDDEAWRTFGLREPLPGGTYVLLEVSDTGCGMDSATLERIFDPFYSTKFVGRGLGLAAVAGIVRAHGGGIAVESVPGQGSTFRVVLPAAAGPREEGTLAPACPSVVEGGLVLLVEDEEVVRRSAARLLERLGFVVRVAAGGQEALEIFATCRDEVRCVLLDLTMPGSDGVETLQALRKLNPEARVILCSGYDRQEVAARLGGELPAAFLKKPFQLAELRDVLQRVLARSS